MFFSQAAGAKWTNRGDAAEEDFIVTDLTFDNTWRDLDFSGIVPKGASLIFVSLKITHTNTNVPIRFRPKGFTVSVQPIGYTTKGALNMDYSTLFLQPDSDGIVQYKGGSVATWVVFTIRVMGWLK